MVIALDMDGTLADLYGVPGWLDAIRHENTAPYEDAAPLCDMGNLALALGKAIASGIRVEVITWGPGGDTSRAYQDSVGRAKRAWLDREGMGGIPMRYKPFQTPKRDGVDGRAILIDDDPRAREDWQASGDGPAIEPRDVVRQIGRIVERYLAEGK